MSQGNSGKTIAEGSVDGATGNRLSGQGFVSARTGAGVYTITLDQAVDALHSQMQVSTQQPSGAASSRLRSFSHTSDSVKTVETYGVASGAPADGSFSFELRQTNF